MGIAILSEGSVGAWSNKVMPPVNRNLEYWGDFTTEAGRFGFNRAEFKPNAAIIGTPTAFNGYGRFKGNVNYLRTEVSETVEMTVISVCRAVVAPTGANDAVAYVSNTSGTSIDGVHTGPGFGVTLAHDGPSNLATYACRDDGTGVGTSSSPANLAGETPTAWGIRIGRTSSGVGTQSQNATRNASSTSAVPNARVLNNLKFCIGSRSSAGTTFGGEGDVAMTMIYSTRLTDSEIAMLIETVIRPRMLAYGIVV